MIMAKKRSKKRDTQTRIEGTYEPVPKALQKIADDFVAAKREKQAWLESEKAKREELIAAMQEAGIAEIEIDDGEKKIVLIDATTVKIQAKKDEPEDAA